MPMDVGYFHAEAHEVKNTRKGPTRIELVNRGFADRSLSHLGTAPRMWTPDYRRHRAGDETRTRDIQLGKLTFYH